MNKRGETITVDGDQWEVVAVGYTREDGKTCYHLVSTTKFVQQRNGKRPVQREALL